MTEQQTESTQAPWKELSRLAEEGQPEQLESFFEGLPAMDAALALSRLSEQEQSRVMTTLPPDGAAEVVEQLPMVQAVEILEHLQPSEAAAIVNELPSNEQADLITQLHDGESVLQQMAPAEAADARALSRYPEHVAGGLMVTEFLRYAEHLTVDEVIADLRQNSSQYRDYDVQYAYVCDEAGQLTGVLRMRDLLLAEVSQPIAELMIRDPLSVRDDAELDELIDFFDRHHYLGVPVVDADAVLVGVVRKSAVDEAGEDRTQSDFLKVQGIPSGEEIRTMPLMIRSRRRLAWLSINIVLNVIAASVIAVFQDTLSTVIALAVFLPIVSDMSGCSGSQAVAVSMRELTLGLVRKGDALRVLFKEVAVGLINGLALGVLIGLVAWLWKGNVFLGLVVGFALCLNTIIAVSIGGVVPVVLKRFNLDPAIASGPILTTITDMCGFFLVLGTATLLLSRLA